MALKHHTIPAGSDQPGFGGVTPTLYAEEHEFSGGTHGAVLVRNTLLTYGSSWIASAAGVLVSSTTNALPSFSASLPNAVMDNINRLGTVTSGVWSAGAISATTGAFSSTLSVTGASTLAAVSATTGSFSSTLGVTGATTLTSVAISTTIALSGDITPAALAADTHNWAPTGIATATTIRMSASAPINLTGITSGTAGRILVLHNAGSSAITLVHNSGSSSAGNRFWFSGVSGNCEVAERQTRLLRYDSTLSSWTLIGTPN